MSANSPRSIRIPAVPAQEELKLPCSLDTNDILRVCDEGVEGIELRLLSSVTHMHQLDKTTARELFNWLGVWLHRN